MQFFFLDQLGLLIIQKLKQQLQQVVVMAMVMAVQVSLTVFQKFNFSDSILGVFLFES